MKSLFHILVIEFGEFPASLVCIRIKGSDFNHPPHGQPQSSQTGLTIELAWVRSDAV